MGIPERTVRSNIRVVDSLAIDKEMGLILDKLPKILPGHRAEWSREYIHRQTGLPSLGKQKGNTSMIKNRTAQLIFQSFYCAIGLIGVVASVGFFEYKFRTYFFTKFTNLSNYLCVGIMFAELIQTAKKKQDSFVTMKPKLKFIGMMAIVLTFLVYNILLAGEPGRDPAYNFSISSVTLHIILPLMFVADWFLFYEKKTVKWTYPLWSTAFPLIYVGFIYIRAWILNFNPDAPEIYPYFFLNLGALGLASVIRWILILLVAFITVGFAFYGIDKVVSKRK